MALVQRRVTFEVSIDLAFDSSLVPDDEWRSHFYPIETEDELAAHLAYNWLANQWPAPQLDGFNGVAAAEHVQYRNESWGEPTVEVWL